jgi:molybdenum storage protein
MNEIRDGSMLSELGRRLVSGSLSDAAIQRATAATPDFAILPWGNVVKIGGQSIMDRGRSAVGPVVDEIVANLKRHKMILGTGAGTRARHVYSLAIDLGLPIGVLTVLGTAVAWQNAQMLHYLLAQHGIAFLEPEGFASLPHYLMERGAVICQGMPPYKLWEANPSTGRIPPERTDTGCFLIAEVFGARKMIYVKDEDGLYTADPKKDPHATHIPRISVQDLLARDLDDLVVERAVLELMLFARTSGRSSSSTASSRGSSPQRSTASRSARWCSMPPWNAPHERSPSRRAARGVATDARVPDGQAADCRDRIAGARDPSPAQRDPDRRAFDHGPRPRGSAPRTSSAWRCRLCRSSRSCSSC